jgi:hypothetical protein
MNDRKERARERRGILASIFRGVFRTTAKRRGTAALFLGSYLPSSLASVRSILAVVGGDLRDKRSLSW